MRLLKVRRMRPSSALRLGARLTQCERGFTLIELLVSMTILGIVVSSLIGIFTSALKDEADLNMRFQAQQDARLALETLRREMHCASAVTQATGIALTTAATSGITLTLGSACPTAGGAATSVSWCARGSARPWSLWRVPGSSTCPASGGVKWADSLTSGTPFSRSTVDPSGANLILVHVTLPVNVRTSGTIGTYRLSDDIALRNSTRS
jgi:prepilin-type N-terminal cleavage/methylation domain-containing protein